MRKLALILAVLMVVASMPGICGVSGTVDGFIENRKNSDLHVISDAGVILDHANQGISAVVEPVHGITGHASPILDPIHTVKDTIIGHTKTVVNKTYDIVTGKHFFHKGK